MPEKKEQKIVVLTENSDSDKILVLHGVKLATAFKKELCLLHLAGKNEKKIKKTITENLTKYNKVVRDEVPSLNVSYLILKGNARDLIDTLADKYEAILIISRKTMYNKLSGALRQSPLAFLFLNHEITQIPGYKKIILPVDLRRETKDAALWASYFARFNNSAVNVLVANDKDKANIRSITKNIKAIKILFLKLRIPMKLYKGKNNSLKIQFEALDIAGSSDAELLIILASSYISIFDLMIGLPEKKIINKSGSLPVLVINPRKDMYIMCD